MKKISAIALVLAFLFTASSAQALTFKSASRSSDTAALATWETVNGNIVHDVSVGADTYKNGSDVFLSICDTDTTTWTSSCKSGANFSNNSNLLTVNKLNTATLASTTIELFDDSGNDVGPTAIAVNWTGSGGTTKSTNKFKSTFGNYSETFSNQSIYRDATATAVLGGSALGSTYGNLIQFKSLDLIRTK